MSTLLYHSASALLGIKKTLVSPTLTHSHSSEPGVKPCVSYMLDTVETYLGLMMFSLYLTMLGPDCWPPRLMHCIMAGGHMLPHTWKQSVFALTVIRSWCFPSHFWLEWWYIKSEEVAKIWDRQNNYFQIWELWDHSQLGLPNNTFPCWSELDAEPVLIITLSFYHPSSFILLHLFPLLYLWLHVAFLWNRAMHKTPDIFSNSKVDTVYDIFCLI